MAAVGGGYLLANAAAILLVRVVPMPRGEAALAMTLLSFALYAVVVIWVFAARSALAAWLGVLGSTALLGGIAAVLGAPTS